MASRYSVSRAHRTITILPENSRCFCTACYIYIYSMLHILAFELHAKKKKRRKEKLITMVQSKVPMNNKKNSMKTNLNMRYYIIGCNFFFVFLSHLLNDSVSCTHWSWSMYIHVLIIQDNTHFPPLKKMKWFFFFSFYSSVSRARFVKVIIQRLTTNFDS